MELTGNHIKAARALLGIDQERLSELSGVSVNTIRTQEASGNRPVAGYASTRDRVQRALEDLGIEFTNGDSPGVRLVKKGKLSSRTSGGRKNP